MWILLICQCKSKWHNSIPSWYSVSPSFLSLHLCFLTILPISNAVAFSLWFMSQWGSVRCLCDKQGVWQIQLRKTNQILAISLHAAFLLPSISVWPCASWKKITSHCSQSIHMLSIPFLPTPHLSPVWLLCHLCSNSVSLLAAGGVRLMDSAFLLALCPDLCCTACSMAVGMLCSVHHSLAPSS